jgi:uncharacterized protein (DUF58 family)
MPFGGIIYIRPEWSVFSMLITGLFAFICLFDYFISRDRPFRLEIVIPALTRMTRGQEGKITVIIRHPNIPFSSILLSLNLPQSFRIASSFKIKLKREAETLQVVCNCLAQRRGKFKIYEYGLEIESALKLWKFQVHRMVESEIRVYPDLHTVFKQVTAFFRNRHIPGIHPQRMIGQGREFEKLREYLPGDPTEMIHWKATAKRNSPISKVFQAEQTQEVYVLIDNSRLSARSISPDSGSATQLDLFVRCGLLLALTAGQQGDLFGLLTFNRQIKTFLRARGGKEHFNTCREQLYIIEPENSSPDFRELSVYLRHKLKKRALLIILTSLDDPILSEEYSHSLGMLSNQHLIVTMMVNSSEVTPLFHNSKVNDSPDLYRQLAGHIQFNELQAYRRVLQQKKIDFLMTPPEQFIFSLVNHYLQVKAKQRL